MIKVECIDVWGFEHAIRGMRNSFNSWDKSDSCFDDKGAYDIRNEDVIGKNDMELMQKLIKAGQTHRKFLRQIFISMDITAPLYWWKEFDTYKVGTVANSCSTMHTIHKKEFTFDDFSVEHLSFITKGCFEKIINQLNICREYYMRDKNKDAWWQIIQLLPSSYNQKRTVTMSYENVLSIIEQRASHKLDEWVDFVSVLRKLPYMKELL